MEQTIQIQDNELSLQRPAWTQYNLHAYRDRVRTLRGKVFIEEDYFVKTEGMIK